MKIPSIVANNSVKLLSGLGDNENSLAAMLVKDWIADGTTVYTYKKEGGKDDAREKAIEEFGTGLFWLLGIPLIKKVIDKTIYPLLKLNPNFDPRVLDDSKFNTLKKLAKNSEKDLFDNLDKANPVIKKFTNAQMYKGMGVFKFLVATVSVAFALTKIIKYKQKTTTDRINKEKQEILSKANSTTLVKNSVSHDTTFGNFVGNDKKTNNISFTGGLVEFMYNPIKNTKILDGVICATRLKEGRKEEIPEILLKEGCNYAAFYALTQPVQKTFERIGELAKAPIKLDPKVLFDKNLAEKIAQSKDAIKILKDSNDVTSTVLSMDIKSPLIKLLEQNDVIKLTKDKKTISLLSGIDEKAVMNTVDNLENMGKNIKNLSKSKAFKVIAIFGNIFVTVAAMGVLQPKLTILLRKIMYGSNENPAIARQEKEAKMQA